MVTRDPPDMEKHLIAIKYYEMFHRASDLDGNFGTTQATKNG
jgi:hypothetical protein